MARKVLQESVGLVEGGRSGWAVMQENSACRRLVRQHQSQAGGDQGDAAGAAVGGNLAAQEVEEDEHQRPSGEGEALAPPDAVSRRFLQVGKKLRRGVSERRPERGQGAPEPARGLEVAVEPERDLVRRHAGLEQERALGALLLRIGLRRIAVGGRVQPCRRAQLLTVGPGTPLSSAPISA